MSNIVLSDDGIALLLDVPFQGVGNFVNNIQACLATNNITPDKSTTLGSLTEATFPGYSRALLGSTWGVTSVTAHVATTVYSSTAQFTCAGGGGPQDIYLVYFIHVPTSRFLGSARMDGVPFTMVNNGDLITETPTFSMQSLFG